MQAGTEQPSDAAHDPAAVEDASAAAHDLQQLADPELVAPVHVFEAGMDTDAPRPGLGMQHPPTVHVFEAG